MKPLFFASAQEFYDWLKEHHASENELTVGFHKKSTGKPSLTWTEAVDQALCFGWIDGIRRSHNPESYTIRFTPRKPKSGWSKVNTLNVERLISEGKMQPAGLVEVQRAKDDGRWAAAYDSPATDAPLPDLEATLATNPKAKAFYDTLNRQNKYSIQYRLQTAIKPETRTKRLVAIIEMLEKGETFHP